MYYRFTELVILEVVLTQFTEPRLPETSHIPTSQFC
jgi:hypothetical protein